MALEMLAKLYGDSEDSAEDGAEPAAMVIAPPPPVQPLPAPHNPFATFGFKVLVKEQRFADASAAAAASLAETLAVRAARPPPPPRRGPGRPRGSGKRPPMQLLPPPTSSSGGGSGGASGDGGASVAHDGKRARKKRPNSHKIDYLQPVYFQPIVRAVAVCGSTRGAVKMVKAAHPGALTRALIYFEMYAIFHTHARTHADTNTHAHTHARTHTHTHTGFFGDLYYTTVNNWYMPRAGRLGEPFVLTERATASALAGCRATSPGGSIGIFKRCPALYAATQRQTQALRDAGLPVQGPLLLALLRGTARVLCPDELVREHGRARDGSSREPGIGRGVSRAMQAALGWSDRRANTKAAQSLPKGWESQVADMHLRLAFTVKTFSVHRNNVYQMDQTFTSFNMVGTGKRTLAPKGSKNVEILGVDDKRGFTSALTNTVGGKLLAIHAVFGGKTGRVDPSGPEADAAVAAGVALWDHTSTHWFQIGTLRNWVEELVNVDFVADCKARGVNPETQHAILNIDHYPVHTSKAFTSWLREHYPRFHLVYVQAGTTGKCQFADVILNRLYNLYMRTRQVRAGPARRGV